MENRILRSELSDRDRLLMLELQIARRADELVREKGFAADLDIWLEAEHEVLVQRAIVGTRPPLPFPEQPGRTDRPSRA